MVVELYFIACLDIQKPGSCIDVQVMEPTLEYVVSTVPVVRSVSMPLGYFGCIGLDGMNIAKDRMRLDVAYAAWEFGGWKCRWASHAKPSEQAI